jgi:hypothetical protein
MPAELFEPIIECPTCASPRVFEQPPCADGHGLDCPERACTECGTAVLLGNSPDPAVSPRIAERHAA